MEQGSKGKAEDRREVSAAAPGWKGYGSLTGAIAGGEDYEQMNGYRAMAADEEREAEAIAWAEAMMEDADARL